MIIVAFALLLFAAMCRYITTLRRDIRNAWQEVAYQCEQRWRAEALLQIAREQLVQRGAGFAVRFVDRSAEGAQQ